jgi:hypothetical protein
VDRDPVMLVAELVRQRNAIDEQIARIIQRPVVAGHLGEWLASQIFDIQLADSAITAGVDGYFRSGALQGRFVNIKWYLKREGMLDTTEATALDYYLVLTGPASSTVSSRGAVRPLCVEAIYLFDAHQLRDEQLARGVKRGVASSVRKQQWIAAQIYPAVSRRFPLTARQTELLGLFRTTT